MRTIYFVTGNQGKIDNMNQILYEFTDRIQFEMLMLDFKEIKDEDSMENTALNKAVTCHEMTGKEVIANDSGIFIEALNGFPGVNTGFTLRTIGNQGIIQLMEGKENRKAMYQVSIGYVNKEGVKKAFTAISDIEIATLEEGEEGFGWDFIALGDGEYFSKNLDNEKRMYPTRETIRQLVEFLEKDET